MNCENCQNGKILKDPNKKEWSWCSIKKEKVLNSSSCSNFNWKNCKDTRKKIGELQDQYWKLFEGDQPMTPEIKKEATKIKRKWRLLESKLFNDNPEFLLEQFKEGR